MFKAKKREDDDSIPEIHTNEVNQEDISDEEVSSIRDTLDASESEGPKKFVTGFRPNPPPKKSWWDKLEPSVRFNGGETLVGKGSTNGRLCKVCCPGKEVGTYSVKFNETRDETIIEGKLFVRAPKDAVYVPYMDEYTKWKYQQDLLKNKKS